MNIKNEVLTVIPKILLSGAVAAALLQSRAIKILILGSSHFLLVLIVHRSVTRKKSKLNASAAVYVSIALKRLVIK